MADYPYQGVLVVDKPLGLTSHQVVAVLRRLLGMRRIGHCGTLDPLASGVLVHCLGRFTRLCQWLSAGDKEYQTTFCLAATSDTGDAQGVVTPHPVAYEPVLEAVLAEAEGLVGEIEQVPPAYSAVKVDGVRSYRLARRHQAVPLAPRRIRIAQLEVLDYAFPFLRLRVVCSAGTYIRSLAADLGERLGCGAYVYALRRCRAGHLDLTLAWSLDQLEEAVQDRRMEQCLVPPLEALAGFPRVALKPEAVRSFMHGALAGLVSPRPDQGDQVYAVCDQQGRFYGMGRCSEEGDQIQPLTVLASEEFCHGG